MALNFGWGLFRYLGAVISRERSVPRSHCWPSSQLRSLVPSGVSTAYRPRSGRLVRLTVDAAKLLLVRSFYSSANSRTAVAAFSFASLRHAAAAMCLQSWRIDHAASVRPLTCRCNFILAVAYQTRKRAKLARKPNLGHDRSAPPESQGRAALLGNS